MEIIKKTLVVLILCSFIMGTVPISVLAQQNSPGNQIIEYKGPNLPDGVEYVPGELIVKFKPGVSNREIANINSKHGTSVIYTSPYAGFKRLHIPKGKSVPEMVEKYNRNPNVEYAEPDYIACASMVPNDYFYDVQWNFDNDEYGGINMEEAWDISSGAGVIVAVLDTGVAYEDYMEGSIEYALAPDLAGTTFVYGYDFVNDDMHPNDDAGHGTHVTGTIAQTTDNGMGVAGIAYNARIMPVKVLNSSGSGYYSWIAEGIRYATANGAEVISMSLGGSQSSTTLEEALSYAYSNGVTIVCSSGNDGSSTTISYPAAYDDYCIAVGATRYDEEVTYYSNGGSSLDLTAPGGQLYERRKMLDQNGDGYWDGILQQTHDGSDYTNFGYYFYQGTSMAAPHVSGVAALLISEGIANTPDEVREALQSTAEDKGPTGWDSEYGWGIVDAYAALNYESAPNDPPVANAGSPYSGTEDTAISFDGSSSSDPDGSITSYDWNFGDSNTGTGMNPTHTYAQDGTYTVTLTVTDNDGATDTTTTTATIGDIDPVAAFTGTPTTGPGPLTVSFSDASTSYDGITAWEWDCDNDGLVDNTTPNPSHVYSIDGVYAVTLTVFEADGDSQTITKTDYITVSNVNQDPTSDPNGPYTGTEGVAVTFNGSSSSDPDGFIVSYNWNFGDSNTGTGMNPTHTYAQDGTYTVTLTVTDNDGATDTTTTTATIGDIDPVAAFTGTPTTGPGPLTVSFSDASTSYDGITAWEWDCDNDGLVDNTTPNPSHVYSIDGVYAVTLTVFEADGDSQTITKTDYITVSNVNQDPTSDPNGPYTGTEGVAVTFDGSGSSDPDGSIVSYDWNFGDSNTGTGMSPVHTYAQDGTYPVTLTVTDNDGATDTSTTTATITEATSLEMHIHSISMSTQSAGINTNAIATVTIVAANNNPVEGATVSGHWTNLTSDTDVGITDASGIVILKSDRVKRASGTFTFIVDNVTHSVFTYNASANVEDQGSIIVP